MAGMDNEPRPRLSDGRFLVPVVLGVVGVMFALCAVPFEPSPSKLALNMISLVMLAAAGASLAVALDGARRRRGSERLPE